MGEQEQEIADLKARLAALEGQSSRPADSPSLKSAPKRSLGANFGCGALGLVGVVALLAMCSGPESTTSSSSSSTDTYAAADAWSPPEGYFRQSTDRGEQLGIKWATPTDSECRGSGVTCFALNVVSKNGCPKNLYVSITILSKTGENIGWTNDTAQGVRPGEPVRLVFDTYERGADTARLVEINCY